MLLSVSEIESGCEIEDECKIEGVEIGGVRERWCVSLETRGAREKENLCLCVSA